MSCRDLVIKVGEKEIVIDDNIVSILNKYARTEFSLEKLAQELGLSNWDEAYEFVKKVPAWIMWVPSSLWKYVKDKICKESS